MGELRAPKRATPSVRRRGEQGRLSIVAGDDDVPSNTGRAQTISRAEGFRRPAKKPNFSAPPDPPKSPAPVFHPLAYRGVVAEWSLEDRERWGRRANELEETGLSWRDAETQAFVEVWFRLHKSNAPPRASEVEGGRS